MPSDLSVEVRFRFIKSHSDFSIRFRFLEPHSDFSLRLSFLGFMIFISVPSFEYSFQVLSISGGLSASP